ncbi:MAG: hypothetical protein QG622_854 [Actinomycetota bacterium]|nr:hypothetical protein [Actinomycetota bacterium]
MPAPELSLPRNRQPVPTRTRLTTWRLPVVAYIAVLVLLPVLVVGGAVTAGWWSTAGHGGVTLSGAGADGGSGAETGERAVPGNPADVRGSMTLREVAAAFAPITTAEILAAFGAPATTPDTTPLKNLVTEGGDGMDIPAFRTWLERHLTR